MGWLWLVNGWFRWLQPTSKGNVLNEKLGFVLLGVFFLFIMGKLTMFHHHLGDSFLQLFQFASFLPANPRRKRGPDFLFESLNNRVIFIP